MNSSEKRLIKLLKRYKDKKDPWGLNIKTFEKAIKICLPLYEKYFKVRVFGTENIKDKSYIVTSNHSGQIPIDAILVGIAFALDENNPRVLRAMVDRFLVKLPFLGELSSQLGAILGDRKNANYLLQSGESLLVFPEGTKGISKNTSDFYKLQPFPNGFLKIAMQNKTPILPVAVIGAEEFYPYVYNVKFLAKLLKMPSFPITPLFPFMGLLGAIPMPSPVDIYIGKAISPPKNEDDILRVKQKTEKSIKEMIESGLAKRRPFSTKISTLLIDYDKK